VIAGLVNPFIVAYLIAALWQLERWRRPTAIATLLCLAGACLAVVLMSVAPSGPGSNIHAEIGHYLWVAGILIVLAPEFIRFPARKAEPCA
jgi:peptidoglycan/LPS O-acetylase OafA/YrhL